MAVQTYNLGTVTAYADAKAGGYRGTKAEWQALMANYATVGQQAAQDAQTATTKANEASASATQAETAAASVNTPDATLTQAGVAADAKAAGDEISDLKEGLNTSRDYIKLFADSSPCLQDHVLKDQIMDKAFPCSPGIFDITATGNNITLVFYKAPPYSASDETNITIVRNYKNGTYNGWHEISEEYKYFHYYAGNNTDGGYLTITRLDDSRLTALENGKEDKRVSVTYVSNDSLIRGTFDTSGVFTESSSGTSYGSDYIPCEGGLPLQYINGGDNHNNVWYQRIYYYDIDKLFISRTESVRIQKQFTADYVPPVNARYFRIAFSYVNSVSWVSPFTINVGKIYSERTSFLYDRSLITIAAHDSTYGDKMTADIVCDGVNDEVELQYAIDCMQSNNLHKGGKIVLLNGTYIIDSLYDSGNADIGKIGIVLRNDVGYAPYSSITIEGTTLPNLKNTMTIDACPVIKLSDTCFESISDTEKVAIIGGLPKVDSEQKPPVNVACTGSWIFKNLGVCVQNPYKCITGINAEWCWNLQMENVQFARTVNRTRNQIIHEIINANDECVGLRTLRGLNNGSGYLLENVNVRGWGTAFDISGEHLTAIGCCARINKTGYRFNFVNNTIAHPNVLINCCDEVCINGIKLYGGNLHPTIEFISYNREINRWESSENPNEVLEYASMAWEEIPGNYYGRVTYAINRGDNYTNMKNAAFWDEGSGINFDTKNLLDLVSGTTQNRPTQPNRNQMYFDTTIGKVIYYIDGQWLDAMGNIVT